MDAAEEELTARPQLVPALRCCCDEMEPGTAVLIHTTLTINTQRKLTAVLHPIPPSKNGDGDWLSAAVHTLLLLAKSFDRQIDVFKLWVNQISPLDLKENIY